MILIPQSVVYRGLLTGLRISSVATGAFVDNLPSAVTDLAAADPGGYLLEIYDATGKVLKGYLGAVGAGETLGSEELQTWTNVTSREFGTLNTAGTNIASAIGGGSVAHAASNAFVHTLTLGRLYKKVLAFTLNGGATPSHTIYYNTISALQMSLGAIAAGSTYVTAPTALCRYLTLYLSSATTTNFTLDSSFKPVDTPTTDGCTIVDSKGGTNYNFAYKNAAFTYNAASYYVIVRKVR